MKRLVLLLMAVLAPATAHCQRPLPPLPDSIHTQIGWITVVRGDSVPALVACDDGRSVGCFNMLQRVIFVRNGLARVMEWKVLLHEIWHQRMVDAHLFLQVDLADRIVDMIANYDLEAMQAPPRPSGP